MKISTILAISVFLLLSSKTAWSEEIVFKNHGRPVKVLTLEQIEKILPATIVTVSEPHESENRRYKGFPTSIRYNTTMPRLNPNAEDRETIIKNIIAYLKAMKNNKREPMTGRD
jgi:hypothetical protein